MMRVSEGGRVRVESVTEGASVTPIELFFDLVFVFALTQVTALIAADLTARGLVRGVLVLTLIWWAWVGYAWLGNVVRADEGVGRVAMFGAMAAMFLIALSVPEAFDDLPGGLSGPVVLALAYLVVRTLHLVIFWLAAKATLDYQLHGQLLRFAPSFIASTTLLLIASQLEGRAQMAMWVAALAADYLITVAIGASGWRLNSASHFAERHGLIVIVALGESIVAIGVGVAQLPISMPIVMASVLGLTLAGAMWWAYFDVVALVAERVLAKATGERRNRIARDSYSFLHLPMVMGIVGAALGLKKVLEYVGDESHHELTEPLAIFPLAVMYGGVALYLFAHVAFRLNNVHTWSVQRVVVGLGVLALIPVAAEMPALAALALVTAVMVGLVAFESVKYAELRERIRHETHDEADAAR